MAIGLFHAGISQSGNAFCFWGVRNSSIEFTYKLANSLRCPVNDSYELVECMRKLDPLLIAHHEATLPVSDSKWIIFSCMKNSIG